MLGHINKKLEKFIKCCDGINRKQIDKISKENVEHIKLEIENLDSSYVRKVLDKDKNKKR